MEDKDRLKKAEKKLREHQDKCKVCDNSIYDVTTPNCSIALQLIHNIDKIKKQMRRH